jgi:hypothetical protein
MLRFSSYLTDTACRVPCERQTEFLIYNAPRPKYIYIVDNNTKSPYNDTNPVIMQTLVSLNVRSEKYSTGISQKYAAFNEVMF